jgi:hypothetical protein
MASDLTFGAHLGRAENNGIYSTLGYFWRGCSDSRFKSGRQRGQLVSCGLLLGPIGLVLAFTAEAKQMPALFWVMLAFLLIGLILLVLPYYYEWMGTIKSVRR